MNYEEYIASGEWRVLRQQVIARDGYRCRLCNVGRNTSKLHVHHRTYERLGRELLDDLTTLCEGCHSKFHDVPRVATQRKVTLPAGVERPKATVPFGVYSVTCPRCDAQVGELCLNRSGEPCAAHKSRTRLEKAA